MTDPAVIRWESLGTIVAVLALAIWALGDPDSGKASRQAPDQLVLRFRIQLKNRPARTIDLLDGARMGRGANCELVLDEPTVSKHHAQIRYDVHPFIEDIGSTNGTIVNGRRADGPTLLKRGDRIALGTAKLVFLGLAPRGRLGPKG